jgi:hypothetical protein
MLNKYRNKWTKCHQNHNHQSKKEADHCNSLELMKRGKAIKDYKTQVSYEIRVNGFLICSHIVDFEVMHNDGRKEIQETKGRQTADFKLKYKLFKALYPEIEYKII